MQHPEDGEFRTCVKCLADFPLTPVYFKVKRKYPDRQTFRYECRWCCNAYAREYDKKQDKVKRNQRNNKYRKERPEKHAALIRRYRINRALRKNHLS